LAEEMHTDMLEVEKMVSEGVTLAEAAAEVQYRG
jgi:hypothetical protein